MKSVLVLSLSLALTLASSGIASADAAKKPEFVIKVGTVAPDGTPWAKSLKDLRKRIHAESNGRIKVKIFWSGALGGEKSLVRRCARGEVQAVGVSSGAVSTLVPEMGVLELPYLFDSLEEADHVLDKFLFDAADQVLADKGFKLHLWAENGYRNFATKDRPIKKPADLEGLKMRSQESWVHAEWYRVLGASPVQIPVPEVLQAVQTGVVDGYDNTLLYGFAVSWYQPITHVSRTKHIYQPALIMYSKKFFESLPDDLQKVVMAQREKDTKDGRAGVRALTPLLVKNYAAAKKQVHELTAVELAAFKALAPGVHRRFLAKVPAAKPLYDLIQKGKADFAKK